MAAGNQVKSQIKKRFGGGFFPDCYTQLLSTYLNSVENYEILIIIDKYESTISFLKVIKTIQSNSGIKFQNNTMFQKEKEQ